MKLKTSLLLVACSAFLFACDNNRDTSATYESYTEPVGRTDTDTTTNSDDINNTDTSANTNTASDATTNANTDTNANLQNNQQNDQQNNQQNNLRNNQQNNQQAEQRNANGEVPSGYPDSGYTEVRDEMSEGLEQEPYPSNDRGQTDYQNQNQNLNRNQNQNQNQ